MDTLFRVKFNWGVYIILIIFIRLIWPGLSWYSFFAIAITLHQFLLLFYSVGAVIPIRYLAGSFMCLQMFVGPVLAFNGLDAYQTDPIFRMKIPETEYFSYVLPAVVLFIAGLHISAGKLKGEVLNEKEIVRFVDRVGKLPLVFIGVGFVAGYVSDMAGAELGFVFYLLSGFKFIGLFMLLLSSKQLNIWALALVFGSIIVTTLQSAMFHDFLTWLIMVGAVLAIKYKPGITLKTFAAAGFILLAVIIQQVKGDYRRAAYSGAGGGAGLQSFENAVNGGTEKKSLFSFASLAESNVRINQGFIVTNIMHNIPANMPFSNGEELYQILEAAFLPRILAPNKLNAGDRTIFTKYSAIPLQPGTSLALSSVGDAYINFGVLGGCFFMFCLGLSFSLVLNGFYKFSKSYPFLLLFTPLVFYYPIRPDCELQTLLGHLVKACMLIYVMLIFWKKDLKKVVSIKKENEEPSAIPPLARPSLQAS